MGTKIINGYNRGDSPSHRNSYDFSIRIVNIVKYIKCSAKKHALANQVMLPVTATGSLVREAEFAQSSSDFITKLSIALKECNETFCRLNLLRYTGFINEKEAESMPQNCTD